MKDGNIASISKKSDTNHVHTAQWSKAMSYVEKKQHPAEIVWEIIREGVYFEELS